MESHKSDSLDNAIKSFVKDWRKALPNERLAHLVRDAERRFKRSLQLRLSEHNISFGHWAFLRILWEKDGFTQRELSELVGLVEPTTHAAILRLQELGYVERRHQPGNRKKLFVYLTPKGQTLKSLLVPLAEEVNDRASAGVSQQDLETTRRTLLTIIDNLALDEVAAQKQGLRITATRDQRKREAGSSAGT